MKNFKKSIALLVAVSMIVGCVIGGALAWLTHATDPVINTFTTSDINITLKETKGGTDREFKMIPGWTIEKDPKASVTAGSEDCYLFVKIEKSNNFDSFMTFEVADGWTPISVGSNVYYRIFDSKDAANTNVKGTQYPVLKDDQVAVKDTVTKTMMNSFDKDQDGELSNAEKEALPKLTFTAYASQLYKANPTVESANNTFTAAEAWENIQTSSGGTSTTV